MPYKSSEKRKEFDRERQHRRRTEATKALRIYKAVMGCAICNERDPAVLTFHHVNNDKAFTIGKKLTKPIRLLFAEVEKCQVLCYNCHMRIHDAERNYEKG